MTELVPKKKGIINWIKNKVEEKPVTIEEIEQLKLKTIKKRMQADIAESDAIIKKAKVEHSMDVLNSLFGPMNQQGKDNHSKESKEKEELRRKTLGF